MIAYKVYRSYMAGRGRYTQPDPIEFLGRDLNLYRYVRSNPLSRPEQESVRL